MDSRIDRSQKRKNRPKSGRHTSSSDPGDSYVAFDVSVVIPLYNKETFVRSTVESVLAQSYPAKEIIVVDDGSTDDSLKQIRNLAGIRIVSQKNAGPSAARNRGVAEATSEWVAFIDADDLWLENHLATLGEVSRDFPGAGLVGSNFAPGDALSARDKAVAPSCVDLFLSDDPPFCASSVAVRRSLLQQSGGFGDFWPGEDVELWARLALDHQVAASQLTTALYRQQTGGLMEQSSALFATNLVEHPLIDMLNAALANASYADRHEAIAEYRDGWLARFARQALVAGRPHIASGYLRRMRPGSRKGGVAMRILAKLPGSLVRPLIRLRSGWRRNQL